MVLAVARRVVRMKVLNCILYIVKREVLLKGGSWVDREVKLKLVVCFGL